MVRGLRQVLGAVGDERRRHLPDLRPAGRGADADSPITAKNLDLRKLAAGEDGEETAKAPWHFKLLMVLLALYLVWRIIQLFA